MQCNGIGVDFAHIFIHIIAMFCVIFWEPKLVHYNGSLHFSGSCKCLFFCISMLRGGHWALPLAPVAVRAGHEDFSQVSVRFSASGCASTSLPGESQARKYPETGLYQAALKWVSTIRLFFAHHSKNIYFNVLCHLFWAKTCALQ